MGLLYGGMKQSSLFLALALAPLLAAQAAEAPRSLFKAGFAEGDITPAAGLEIPGGYGKAFHQKFSDPCKVRAAVFDDGQKRVAFVGVDALMVPRALVERARLEIRARCGIEPEAVLIGASHSHSSGPVGMVQPGEYDGASDLVRKLAYQDSSCANAAYLDLVRTRMVEAVERASATRAEARCAVGAGQEDQAAYNRRFRMKNGLTFTHPGKGNPDIQEVAGPIDPQVGVVGVWDAQDKLLGCLVNYACHATTGASGSSANWIYHLEKVVRGAFHPGVVVVFLQGFAGDVTQVDNLDPYNYRYGKGSGQFVGGRVGAEVVKVLTGLEPGAIGPVDAKARVLELPRRAPDPERVKRCREIVLKKMEEAGHAEWTFAKEIVLLDAALAKQPVMPAEVQAIQVGPAVFLTNPGEVFCQFGLDLKKRCGFAFTFPVELANGCIGYIPTEEALGEHGGGYETRLTSYSNLVPEAGRRLNEAALELARQLQPGAVPRPPKAPPFSAPWPYGNVPPELK